MLCQAPCRQRPCSRSKCTPLQRGSPGQQRRMLTTGAGAQVFEITEPNVPTWKEYAPDRNVFPDMVDWDPDSPGRPGTQMPPAKELFDGHGGIIGLEVTSPPPPMSPLFPPLSLPTHSRLPSPPSLPSLFFLPFHLFSFSPFSPLLVSLPPPIFPLARKRHTNQTETANRSEQPRGQPLHLDESPSRARRH